MDKLSYAQVSAVLTYEPLTGKLFWRERPAVMFKDGTIGREAAARRWNKRYAGEEAFTSVTSHGYRQGSIFDLKLKAHQVAWMLVHGEWPRLLIDHINGIKTDNRETNLREVTKSGNARNQVLNPRNTSGVCGVTWAKRDRRWTAQIKVDGDYLRLGSFQTFEEARDARMAANLAHGFVTRPSL